MSTERRSAPHRAESTNPDRRRQPLDSRGLRKILGGRAATTAAISARSRRSCSAASADESSEERFELDSAYQGEEALHKVKLARERQRPYALLFVDVRMPPGLDGIQTTARLLERGPRRRDRDLLRVLGSQLGGDDVRVRHDRPRADPEEAVRHGRGAAARARSAAALGARAARGAARRGPHGESSTRKPASCKAANEALKREAALREDALRRLGESNEQIRALAYQDGLTGLPNRRLFNEHLEKVLARVRAARAPSSRCCSSTSTTSS